MLMEVYDPADSAEFYSGYYALQGGDGLSFFSGKRDMEGNGFFGDMFKAVAPTLKNLGGKFLKTAVSTGLNMAKDVAGGKSFKASAKRGLRELGTGALDDVVSVIEQPAAKKRRKKKSSKQRGHGVFGPTIFD